MKRLFSGLLAGLMLAATVTPALAQINPGEAFTNFSVQNLDSTGVAQVQASYIDQNGTVAATVPSSTAPDPFLDIPANESAGFPAATSGLPQGFNGSAIVSGDKELAAFAQMFWEGGDIGKTLAAYEAFRAGSTKIYFPSLFARLDKQESSITIQSAESASTTDQVTYNITFFDREGNQSKTITGEQILKGTQKTYNLMSLPGTPLPTTTPPGDGWIGAAVVESTSPLAGVAITHWTEDGGYSAAYSAVPAPPAGVAAAATGAGVTAFLPSITRRVQPGDNWLQWTGINVQNLDPDPANVEVEFYDRNGALLHEFTDSVDGNSAKGYNTRFDANTPNPGALFMALGTDLNGSVVIRSTNDKNIVAIANLQWSAQAAGVGLAGNAYTSVPGGDDTIYVPNTFRLRQGNSESGAFDQFTGLIVQNIGTAACTNFQVQWLPRPGEGNSVTFNDSLDPNISHGYNTNFGGNIPSGTSPTQLGANYRGAVVINAPGCALTAIHNTLFPLQTESSTYNAFGK
jgi:hypothetical protein